MGCSGDSPCDCQGLRMILYHGGKSLGGGRIQIRGLTTIHMGFGRMMSV